MYFSNSGVNQSCCSVFVHSYYMFYNADVFKSFVPQCKITLLGARCILVEYMTPYPFCSDTTKELDYKFLRFI